MRACEPFAVFLQFSNTNQNSNNQERRRKRKKTFHIEISFCDAIPEKDCKSQFKIFFIYFLTVLDVKRICSKFSQKSEFENDATAWFSENYSITNIQDIENEINTEWCSKICQVTMSFIFWLRFQFHEIQKLIWHALDEVAFLQPLTK